MRQYELTYLVSDDVSESELTKVTGKVGGLITELKGKIIKEESWGRRKLAYPINKTNFATFVTVYFEIDPEKILPFGKDLRHVDKVLRQLIIAKDYKKEELILTSDDIIDGEEIAEVVGGEKSAEIATEDKVDNRDLMAKRSSEKTEEPKDLETKGKDNEDEKAESSDTPEKPEAKVSTEKVEKPKKAIRKKAEEKPVTTEEKKEAEKKSVNTEEPADKDTQKTTTKKMVKKTPTKTNIEDEADRLSKLDDELDELLRDEI